MTAATPTNWQNKMVTPDEALERIEPGMNIFLGTGAAEPRTLVKRLMASEAVNLQDLTLIQLVSLGDAIAVEALSSSKYRLKTFFSGWVASEAIASGRVDLIPSRISMIPWMIKSRQLPVDAAIIQISPPDENGLCSLGIAVDVGRRDLDDSGIHRQLAALDHPGNHGYAAGNQVHPSGGDGLTGHPAGEEGFQAVLAGTERFHGDGVPEADQLDQGEVLQVEGLGGHESLDQGAGLGCAGSQKDVHPRLDARQRFVRCDDLILPIGRCDCRHEGSNGSGVRGLQGSRVAVRIESESPRPLFDLEINRRINSEVLRTTAYSPCKKRGTTL